MDRPKKLKEEKNMEGLNLEILALLLGSLAFGSSLIHYQAFARARAVKQLKNSYKE